MLFSCYVILQGRHSCATRCLPFIPGEKIKVLIGRYLQGYQLKLAYLNRGSPDRRSSSFFKAIHQAALLVVPDLPLGQKFSF